MHLVAVFLHLLFAIELVGKAHRTVFNFRLADFTRCTIVSPDILIWVQGRAESVHQRTMIRETIGDKQFWPNKPNVMIVFFMGKPSAQDTALQSLLDYEFEQYRDIVQTDFTENYRNQTYKMMTALNYISEFCYLPALVLKIDDDVIFHPTFMLNKLIYAMSNHTVRESLVTLRNVSPKTIACHLISDYEVWRVKDHPQHVQAIDDSVLPGETIFPPFCAGFFIAMSGDVPLRLQVHIVTNNPFWMDDRYMGVLQEHARIRNVHLNSLIDFGYGHLSKNKMKNMIAKKTIVRHLPFDLKGHLSQLFQFLELASHGVEADFMTIRQKKKN